MSNPAAHSGENTKFIILIACVATIGGFLFGFDSGVINGTVDGLQQAFGPRDEVLAALQQAQQQAQQPAAPAPRGPALAAS